MPRGPSFFLGGGDKGTLVFSSPLRGKDGSGSGEGVGEEREEWGGGRGERRQGRRGGEEGRALLHLLFFEGEEAKEPWPPHLLSLGGLMLNLDPDQFHSTNTNK